MATLRSKSYLLTRFEAGDRPTDVDFADLFESICILGEPGTSYSGATTFNGDVSIGGTLLLSGQFTMPAELMVGSISETLSMPIQAYSSTDETVIFASGSISDNLFQGVSGDSTSSIRLQDDLTHVRFGTHTNKGFLEVHGEEIIYYTTGSSTTPNLVHISGSVGINTEGAGTSYNLDVHGDTNGIIRAYGPSIGRYSLENSSKHYSTSVQGSQWYFFDETVGASRMIIESDGDVKIFEKLGVGITPTEKLHVKGTTSATRIKVETTTGNAQLRLQTNTGHFALVSQGILDRLDIFDNNTLYTPVKIFGGNPNNTLVLDGSGKVGIGTDGPGHKLHLFDSTNDVNLLIQSTKTNGRAQIRFKNDVQEFVAGTTTSDNFAIYDGTSATTPFIIEPGTGTNTLYLDSNERVAIGKSNPEEKLTIHQGHVSMSRDYGLINHHNIGNQEYYGIYPFQGGNSYNFSNISNTPTPGANGVKLESDQYIHFVESDGNTLGVQFDMNQRQFRFDGPITASHFVGDGSGLTGVNAQQVVGFITDDVDNYVTTAAGNGTLQGEQNLQFNGSQLYVNGKIGVGQSNPTAQLHVGSTRPIKIGAGAVPGSPSIEGSISSKGTSAGGWANSFKFLGSSNTDHGGFYGHGDSDTFNKWGIAPAYNNAAGLHIVSAGSGATEVKVGIGTLSPTSLLHIHASSTATASLHIESDGSNKDSSIHLRQSGTLNASTGVDLVYDGGADYFMLKGHTYTNGLEGEGFKYKPQTDDNTLVLQEHHKIGMGILSPQYNLHVYSGSGHPSILVETGTGGDGAYIRFKDDNQHWRLGKNEDDNFALYDTTGVLTPISVEKATPSSTLYLKDTGNVGIGTNNPSSKLHVVNGSNHIYLHDTSLNDPQDAYLTIKSSTASHKIAGLNLKIDSTNLWQVLTDNADGNRFHIQYNDDATKRFVTVAADGKVGIGTTSPDAKLMVHGGSVEYSPSNGGTGMIEWVGGTSNYTGYLGIDDNAVHLGHNSSTRGLHFQTDETTRMAISSGGNVGIGTTAPATLLHIHQSGTPDETAVELLRLSRYTSDDLDSATPVGEAYIAMHVGDASTGEGSEREVARISFAQDNAANGEDDGRLDFFTRRDDTLTRAMMINHDGEVGIGTNNPTYNLHVVGTTNITGDLTVGGNQTFNGAITFPAVQDTGGSFPIFNTALIFPGTDDSGRIQYGFTADDAFQLRVKLTDGHDDKFVVFSDTSASDKTPFQTSANLTLINQDLGKVGIGTNTGLATNAGSLTIKSSGTIGGTTMLNSHLLIGTATAGMGFDVNEIYAIGGNSMYVGTMDNYPTHIRSNGSTTTATFEADGRFKTGPSLRTQLGHAYHTGYASISHKDSADVAGNYGMLMGSGGDLFLNVSTGEKMYFRENNVSKMIIDGGDVGIGTSTMSAKLHVYHSGADSVVDNILILEHYGGDITPTPGGPAILFKNTDSNNAANHARIKVLSTNTLSGATDTFGNVNAYEHENNMVFTTMNNGTEYDRMTINWNGNVGIGTLAAKAGLHVRNAGDEMLRLEDTSTSGSPYMSFYQTSTRRAYIQLNDTSNTLILNAESGPVQLMSNGQHTLMCTTGQDVGVGTTTTSYHSHGSTTSGTTVYGTANLLSQGNLVSKGEVTSHQGFRGMNFPNNLPNKWFNLFHVPLSAYGYNCQRLLVKSQGNSSAANVIATIDLALKNQSGSTPGNAQWQINNYGSRKLGEFAFEVMQWSQGGWNGGARDGTSDAVNASSYPRIYDAWLKMDSTTHDHYDVTLLGDPSATVNWGDEFLTNTAYNTLKIHNNTYGGGGFGYMGTNRWNKHNHGGTGIHTDADNQAVYISSATTRYGQANRPRLVVDGRTTQGSSIGLQDYGTDNMWIIGYESGDSTDSFSFRHASSDSATTVQHAFINQAANNDLSFTGQHFCMPSTGQITDYIDHIGKIVSSTGEYINHASQENLNSPNINEALPKVKLTDETNDKKVFGVISDTEDPNEGSRTSTIGAFSSVQTKQDDRLIVNSIGEGGIWVSNYNGNLVNGDYITTSPIQGVGQKQNDDLLHNYTVAKITQDCDFDNTTDLVSCQAPDGTYQMKFVGCTYHCG